jgi:hypothetical protein
MKKVRKSVQRVKSVVRILSVSDYVDWEVLETQEDLVNKTLPRFEWNIKKTVQFLVDDLEYSPSELEEYDKLIPVLHQLFC